MAVSAKTAVNLRVSCILKAPKNCLYTLVTKPNVAGKAFCKSLLLRLSAESGPLNCDKAASGYITMIFGVPGNLHWTALGAKQRHTQFGFPELGCTF